MKRKRTERRAEARAWEKDRRERERLVAISPGGSASNPIDVTTASLVEAAALALGCGVCGGSLRLGAHDAVLENGIALRRVSNRCVTCGATRVTFLRIVPQLHS
jgi:hypothetical protein